MTDEEFSRYLTRFGDRVALKAYAKLEEESRHHGSLNERKLSLREKLVAKLHGKQKSLEHLKRAVPQSGNMNAKKKTKKIELGWLHEYGCLTKQVRSPNGGGTRTLEIQLDCKIGDIMPVAQEVFFPGGHSKKGAITDFCFHIADQTHTKLDMAQTFRELFENTKLKHLRLYMVTRQAQMVQEGKETKVDDSEDNSNQRIEMSTLNAIESLTDSSEFIELEMQVENSRTKLNNRAPGHLNEGAELNSFDGQSIVNESDGINITHLHDRVNERCVTSRYTGSVLDLKNPSGSCESLASVNVSEPGEILIEGYSPQECHSSLSEIFSITRDYTVASSELNRNVESTSSENNDSDGNGYLQEFLLRSVELDPNSPSNNSLAVIRIHRAVVLNELIQVFKDPTISDKTLQYIFVDEHGHDAQGVSRDVYSAFWEAFLLKFTDGEGFRIPVLSNELADTEWEAVGRILLKGYRDHRYFPVSIAPGFFVALCHGENAVTPEILKTSFLSYLSISEKELIEQALSGEEHDRDDLIELLDRFECRIIPEQENLLSLILQIAHRVVIQEPKYALDALQRVGKHFWITEFPSIDSILTMYEKLQPSVQKVLALLKASPVTKEQSDSLKYMQRFVRGRNKDQLKHLLRFLTGSDMLCVSSIEVTFVVRHGVGRVPTAHTCGPVLELPSTYVSYPDFRNEWESILQAKENMAMMIA